MCLAIVLAGCGGLSKADLARKYHISTDYSYLVRMMNLVSKHSQAQNKETYLIINKDGVGTIVFPLDELNTGKDIYTFIFDTKTMLWHNRNGSQSYPFKYNNGIITMDYAELIDSNSESKDYEIVPRYIELKPYT